MVLEGYEKDIKNFYEKRIFHVEDKRIINGEVV